MIWTNVALIFVAGTQLSLGILVFLKNPKNKINISFSLTSIALSSWVLVTALFYVSGDVDAAMVLCQLKLSLGLLTSFLLQVFTLFFPFQKNKVSLGKQILILVPTLVSLVWIWIFPFHAIEQISLSDVNIFLVNKLFWSVFSFALILNFLVAVLGLFSRLREHNSYLTIKLVFVITAILVPLLFSLVFNIILLFFDIFVLDWIGALLTVVFSSVLYYFVFFSKK